MSSELADIQRQFAAHLREPNIHAAPEDIEDRRMKIYRDLIYNNIERFISSAFPIIRKLYSDTHWHEMVRDFVHRHQSQTPYFLEISEEFLAYLEHERELAMSGHCRAPPPLPPPTPHAPWSWPHAH